MKLLVPTLLLAATAVWADTLVVGDSIQSAVAAARPGDTLVLPGPRVFYERVVLDKPLRLIGTNSPVIDAQGQGAALTITQAGAVVRDITLRHSGRDLTRLDSGIMITAPRVTVRGCRIENDAFGIYLRGARQCTVVDNIIVGDTNLPTAQRGNGIQLWNTASNLLTGNRIVAKRDGIYLSYADACLLADNRVTDSRFGIHYMYSHRNQLLTNNLTANVVGATLMFARDCVIAGNHIHANRRHGLLLKQVERSRIAHNVMTGHNRGLFVQQAAQNLFVENRIEHNDIGLYLSGGSEQNVFTGNAFVANADQVWQPTDEFDLGRRAANTFYAEGRGNFWSDYLGADRDHNGIGDTPYHETDVFGYLLDRNPNARLFALSPAVALLRKGEELMPLLDLGGVSDLFPLMHPPAGARRP